MDATGRIVNRAGVRVNQTAANVNRAVGKVNAAGRKVNATGRIVFPTVDLFNGAVGILVSTVNLLKCANHKYQFNCSAIFDLFETDDQRNSGSICSTIFHYPIRELYLQANSIPDLE